MVAFDRRQLLSAIALAAAGPVAAQLPLRRQAPLRHDAVQSLIDAYVAKGAVPGAVVALVEPGKHKPVFVSAGVTAVGGTTSQQPESRQSNTAALPRTPEPTIEGILNSQMREQPVQVGRNDPCPCGSGKKFKLCHGR